MLVLQKVVQYGYAFCGRIRMNKTSMFLKLFNWLRKQGASGSVLGDTLKLADRILSNPFVQTFALTVYSIIITIVTSYYGNKCFKSKIFWTIIFVFFIYLVATCFVNYRMYKKVIDVRWFKHLVKEIELTHSYSSQKMSELIEDIEDAKIVHKRDITKVWGFERAAFAVCREIYNMICELKNTNNAHITIFQKFYNTEEEYYYTKMIAYQTRHGKEPDSKGIKYKLFGNLEEGQSKKYFHQEIFESNSSQIRILSNKDELVDKFEYHLCSIDREKSISQYIGIPVKSRKDGVIFLLQIDIDENIFGNSKDEILEFISNIFVPYSTLLYVYYEQERLNEELRKKILYKCTDLVDNINKE